MTEQIVSIRQKTPITNSLSSTMAQQFCKQLCGVSSLSLKVSKRVKDHAKRTMVSVWADGEHTAKNTKIQIHIPPKQSNEFISGLLEHFHPVQGYLKALVSCLGHEPCFSKITYMVTACKYCKGLYIIVDNCAFWLSFYGQPGFNSSWWDLFIWETNARKICIL